MRLSSACEVSASVLCCMQDDVAHEAETGKIYRTEFHDKQGRTVLIMAPGRQVRQGLSKVLRVVNDVQRKERNKNINNKNVYNNYYGPSTERRRNEHCSSMPFQKQHVER